jgi:GTP-dependent phosphoenolpyruvate carboxykinase
MGPIGFPVTKIAVQITDPPYAVTNRHVIGQGGDESS